DFLRGPAPMTPPLREADRVTVVRLQQTLRQPVAKPDRFAPKGKSRWVAIRAEDLAEPARAVSPESAQSLCLCPSGGIRRRRAAPHRGSSHALREASGGAQFAISE